MIRAEFYESKGNIYGFKISGHAEFAESGNDIVCAAVSSAVQLTVNNIDAFTGCIAEIDESDNSIICHANSKHDKNCGLLINKFRQHLEAISNEFPKTIKITTTEV